MFATIAMGMSVALGNTAGPSATASPLDHAQYVYNTGQLTVESSMVDINTPNAYIGATMMGIMVEHNTLVTEAKEANTANGYEGSLDARRDTAGPDQRVYTITAAVSEFGSTVSDSMIYVRAACTIGTTTSVWTPEVVLAFCGRCALNGSECVT